MNFSSAPKPPIRNPVELDLGLRQISQTFSGTLLNLTWFRMGGFGAELKFNRVPEKVPEKVRLWCRARSGSTGFRRRSGRFGAGPGQVQQGSGKDSGEGSGRLWCSARSGSTGFQRRFRGRFRRRFGAEPGQVQQGSGEALVQSQEGDSSGEGLGSFGAKPGQVQQGSKEGSGEGSGGFGAEPGQVQQGSAPKPLRSLLRNPVEHDLALHQSFPDLLRNLHRNLVEPDPVPAPVHTGVVLG